MDNPFSRSWIHHHSILSLFVWYRSHLLHVVKLAGAFVLLKHQCYGGKKIEAHVHRRPTQRVNISYLACEANTVAPFSR